ncbi:benzaldehyde lyase [Colletotrichum incanum]|uniref:Benzaldehyde lyase n=1 Tax=Colletotrichum incanum TaxID=1573173 RepID=A0A161WJB1_COLIC|nr:benzaldehyde lyase [Colletotrichum incanum]
MAFQLKYPKNRELVGGDLAQSLVQLGAKVAFGIHGRFTHPPQHWPPENKLTEIQVGILIASSAAVEAEIKLVDVRHETVAVQAAEGWAKVKGNNTPGLCFITANSGFCNGLPGLSTAFSDRSPVFCITSSPPLRDAETNTLQGFHDRVVLSKPVTKFAHRVTNVSEIPRIVSLAWRATTVGAPGPVLVDFPIDVLFTPVQMDNVAWGSVTALPVSFPAPDARAIDEAIGLWKEAKRPVIIVSTGAARAGNEVTRLAETTNTPVFHSPSTTIQYSHPVFAGAATQLPFLLAQGQAPDFVLLLGARTGFLIGGRSGTIVPNENAAKVVQVDLDGSEIGRSRKIDVGIVSDVGLAAHALTVAASKFPFKSLNEWLDKAMSLKRTSVTLIDNESEPVSLPENSIVCIDGGEASGWALQCLNEARAGLSMVTTGYLGFLGNGFGYSLGAAVAAPDKLVINLHGDGSVGFHIGELDTYAKFGLSILTVIINNSVWGMSQAGQDMVYGEKTPQRPCIAMNPAIKYDIVAQGFGCESAVVDVIKEDSGSNGQKTLETLKETVRSPALLNLKVSDLPYHSSTKAMIGLSNDPNTIFVPYYDNLPRPYYKKSTMETSGSASEAPIVKEDTFVEGHGTFL